MQFALAYYSTLHKVQKSNRNDHTGATQWRHREDEMRINFLEYTRRQFMKQAAIAAAVGATSTGLAGSVFAASETERVLAAAKGVKPVGLRGMIWSNYMAAMKASEEEFKKLTGIGIASIQDISIFVIPQRAMAEAISRSDKFDFFHVDSNMIPTLASAGML